VEPAPEHRALEVHRSTLVQTGEQLHLASVRASRSATAA
jgi:hypothetical protein